MGQGGKVFFSFGKNWKSFLSVLDEERIQEAMASLRLGLDCENLAGRTFLDAGSGSGLFSLAASRLGAQVHSFDMDPESVDCAKQLKSRYFPDDEQWVIDRASVLDRDYLKKAGAFDVVYSWGVLHHTGDMLRAFENVTFCVKPGGKLFISIYNHQPYWSAFYKKLKYLYSASPAPAKAAIAAGYISVQVIKGFLKDILTLKDPLSRYKNKKKMRGMSVYHDWIDWIGGYPFETARPEDVFNFFKGNGFELVKLKTSGGGHGCNEFVFLRKTFHQISAV
jgi:2-polyprenyl-3-methyl-5-hydroxy-6-metoxy-1,4-benzoquinol methylase